MFARSIEAEFTRLMQEYPVVTVTGPRQSGKTTLAKSLHPEKSYYNLENPDTRAFITSDPRAFFNELDLNTGVILDEIQRAPELLSYIQTIVDDNRIPGAFILTGSHQLQLNEAITQSLAGRTAILELLPLSINELSAQSLTPSTNEYLLNGFYPAIYQHQLDAVTYQRNYIKTYVERDVRQLINVKDIHAFQRFITLCAGRIGSTLNRDALSAEVGVSQNTIKHWLSILEASYLTCQLQPYFDNLGKRVIKSPKLYFLDVGIASYLLSLRSIDQINHDKMRGNLFENMIVIELLKHQYNQGKDSNIYFYRDSHQNEVDIILQNGQQLIPIEIKSTQTFHPSLLKNLHYFQKIAGDRATTGYLIYAGEHEQRIGNIEVLNYKNMSRIMK